MNRLVWPGSIRQARLKIPIHFADDTVTLLSYTTGAAPRGRSAAAMSRAGRDASSTSRLAVTRARFAPCSAEVSDTEGWATDEFSVTLMRTKVTPGTVRYDAEEDEDAFLRNVYVNKRAFKGGRFPELLLVTVREAPGDSAPR
jgi:hypothetical protein